MAGPIVARSVLVSGVVQGVGYRYWASKLASELGLVGWVRNLHDGRVQIHAEGSAEQVDALVKQCWRGPRSARVAGVIEAGADVKQHAHFTQVASAALHSDVTEE